MDLCEASSFSGWIDPTLHALIWKLETDRRGRSIHSYEGLKLREQGRCEQGGSLSICYASAGAQGCVVSSGAGSLHHGGLRDLALLLYKDAALPQPAR